MTAVLGWFVFVAGVYLVRLARGGRWRWRDRRARWRRRGRNKRARRR